MLYLRNLIMTSLLACFMATGVQAAPISVFATGNMPVSALTTSADVWTFSGSFSDSLVDAFGSSQPGGHFEFELSDLAALDFSINGTSIAFKAPSPFLLDSRISLFGNVAGFSLFFDVSDPFFGGAFANAAFGISLQNGPYASDTEDLTTLFSFSESNVATNFSLQPVGGSFTNSRGTGSVSVNAVPLPASLPLFAGGLGLLGLLGWRRRSGAKV